MTHPTTGGRWIRDAATDELTRAGAETTAAETDTTATAETETETATAAETTEEN